MDIKSVLISALRKQASIEKRADTPKVNYYRSGRPLAPIPQVQRPEGSGVVHRVKRNPIGTNLSPGISGAIEDVVGDIREYRNTALKGEAIAPVVEEALKGPNALFGAGAVDPNTGRISQTSGFIRDENDRLENLKRVLRVATQRELVSERLAAIRPGLTIPRTPWYRPIKRWRLKKNRQQKWEAYLKQVPGVFAEAARDPSIKERISALEEGKIGDFDIPLYQRIQLEQGDPMARATSRGGISRDEAELPQELAESTAGTSRAPRTRMYTETGDITLAGMAQMQRQLLTGFLRQAQQVGIDAGSDKWYELRKAFEATIKGPGGPQTWNSFMANPAVQDLQAKMVETGMASPVQAAIWLRAVGMTAARSYSGNEPIPDYK